MDAKLVLNQAEQKELMASLKKYRTDVERKFFNEIKNTIHFVIKENVTSQFNELKKEIEGLKKEIFLLKTDEKK